MDSILIIGGSGMLGTPVAKALKNAGFKVGIFSRNIDKAQKILGTDFEFFQGDVTQKKDLKNALNNYQGVHINLQGEIEYIGVKNVVQVARNTGIQRITYISGTSVNEQGIWFPQTERKYKAELVIKNSGIGYTIFCPTWFMESLPKYIKNGKAFVFGNVKIKFHFIAAKDYARMVVNAYKNPLAINKRFILHGPEAWEFKDALEFYCKCKHLDIQKVSVIPFFLATIIAKLKKSKQMAFAVDFMKFFNKTGELGDPSEANEILGKPTITLSQWCYAQ